MAVSTIINNSSPNTINTHNIPDKINIKTSNSLEKQKIIDNLINLAKQEQLKGNKSITSDKLNKLEQALNQQQKFKKRESYSKFSSTPLPPPPKYPSIYEKFKIKKTIETSSKPSEPKQPPKEITKKKSIYKPTTFTFKKFETIIIGILETLANFLDNLHLISNLPMFPNASFLTKLLKNTNKLWILILVFLIRKTITQLINVYKKINKINVELNILNKQSKGNLNHDINKKYNKILKDLKFDRMMLIIELIGNFMDLLFNLIEVNGINLPDWLMSLLNFSSMAMTVYRMNKDDEYIDDDITEDLI
ncbi:unnamed protein product [Candida verbasci]|uniref:Uncharacterized protein n=1 Tax=Candida verbasci TaxID=1227364 RepID=A0A9W4TS58_9ASCO|nr:unnamed protein product [Candida verbasci]